MKGTTPTQSTLCSIRKQSQKTQCTVRKQNVNINIALSNYIVFPVPGIPLLEVHNHTFRARIRGGQSISFYYSSKREDSSGSVLLQYKLRMRDDFLLLEIESTNTFKEM